MLFVFIEACDQLMVADGLTLDWFMSLYPSRLILPVVLGGLLAYLLPLKTTHHTFSVDRKVLVEEAQKTLNDFYETTRANKRKSKYFCF